MWSPTCRSLPVQHISECIFIGSVTLREELSLTISASPASNRERNNDSFSDLDFLGFWTYTLHNSAAFVAEYIAFL